MNESPHRSEILSRPLDSIAVLPFANISSDPEQEYFSDGISEEIINTLAQLPNLKVAGRTSSFTFKGKNEDLRTVGEKLNVRTILEGSVRSSGNRIRITAQLINVENGYCLVLDGVRFNASVWCNFWGRTDQNTRKRRSWLWNERLLFDSVHNSCGADCI